VLSRGRLGTFFGKGKQCNTDSSTVASTAVNFCHILFCSQIPSTPFAASIYNNRMSGVSFLQKRTPRVVWTTHAFLSSIVIPTCLPAKAPYSINQLYLQNFKIWITEQETTTGIALSNIHRPGDASHWLSSDKYQSRVCNYPFNNTELVLNFIFCFVWPIASFLHSLRRTLTSRPTDAHSSTAPFFFLINDLSIIRPLMRSTTEYDRQ
jgi:hypothetical protein